MINISWIKFHVIEYNPREIYLQIHEKISVATHLYSSMCTQSESMMCFIIYTSYINFCVIPCNKNRDMGIQDVATRNLEKKNPD